MAEYRIDDLARAAGTTARRVRAYHERGLLPPPEKRGRVGYYNDSHRV
jgi:DNA-binding transcriptional MerR regulator